MTGRRKRQTAKPCVDIDVGTQDEETKKTDQKSLLIGLSNVGVQ